MKNMFIATLALIATVLAGRAGEAARGVVTDLPLPRFVSIGADKANARRGPSLRYQIDWVYQRKGLPVIITAEHGHWRRVRDHDGKGGWMHYALLSGVRTGLVKSANAPMRLQPDINSYKVAILEQNVVAQIDECIRSWCWLKENGYEGWVSKNHLWGVQPGEIIE